MQKLCLNRKSVISDWEKMWEKGETFWIADEFNEGLTTHFDNSTVHSAFVPLCRNTLGMIFLRNKGVSVVGVEFNESAVKRFFEENDLQYERHEASPLPYYKTKNGVEVRIYVGDLYKFRSTKKFDLIWDRGSMVAINPDDRGRYGVLLSSLLSDHGQILIEALRFGENKKDDIFKNIGPPGAPYNLLTSHLENIYLNHDMKILSMSDWDHPMFGSVQRSYIQVRK